MDSINDALAFAKKEAMAVWTLLKGREGLFHVYPGGRIVKYKWVDPRAIYR